MINNKNYVMMNNNHKKNQKIYIIIEINSVFFLKNFIFFFNLKKITLN